LAGEGGQPNQRVFVLNLERAMGIEPIAEYGQVAESTS